MTKIKFYVGRGTELRSRLLLACQLTKKALQHDLCVYIHAEPDALQQIDELLWTFSEKEFIPHGFAPDTTVKVEMGYDFEPVERCNYLINLSNESPAFFSRFTQMAEIIDQTNDILKGGRDRYRFYKDSGYKLVYHKL